MSTVSDRRVVELSNYRNDEGICSCGCRKESADVIMLSCQCLVRRLSRKYGGAPVQHRVTGGARCKAKNDATPGSARYSYHLVSAALDGTFWTLERETKAWAKIPCEVVAEEAKAMGIFGGIGWRKYRGAGDFIHLDVRPGQLVEW